MVVIKEKSQSETFVRFRYYTRTPNEDSAQRAATQEKRSVNYTN
jgi:hypothetical protein